MGPVTAPPPPSRSPAPPAAAGRAAAPPTQAPPPGLPTRTRSGSHRPSMQLAEDSDDIEQPRLSHVRILPTSLPYVHEQLMEQREREREQRARAANKLMEDQAQVDEDGETTRQNQEATAKALKPHARSIVDLEKLRFDPPEGRSAPHQPKKTRKWQFGIRSRNQPYEAMLYLYKAIAAQGGIWDIQPAESGMLIRAGLTTRADY